MKECVSKYCHNFEYDYDINTNSSSQKLKKKKKIKDFIIKSNDINYKFCRRSIFIKILQNLNFQIDYNYV